MIIYIYGNLEILYMFSLKHVDVELLTCAFDLSHGFSFTLITSTGERMLDGLPLQTNLF